LGEKKIWLWVQCNYGKGEGGGGGGGDVQNVGLILQDSLFNFVSPGTSIRYWTPNKGKPGAAGHIVDQYGSKKIIYTYIRSGESNRYGGKT